MSATDRALLIDRTLEQLYLLHESFDEEIAGLIEQRIPSPALERFREACAGISLVVPQLEAARECQQLASLGGSRPLCMDCD